MNRKELNLLNMFKTVDQFADDNKAELVTYSPIIASQSIIKRNIEDIVKLSQTQANNSKVHTALKLEEKIKLNLTVLKVSSAMSAVAAANSDTELKIISNIGKTKLNRAREADYNINIQRIYKAAMPIAAQLLVWGVTPEDIESLNTGSILLMQRAPHIRNVKVVTKQASAEIKQKIIETHNEIKNTLDALMSPFNALNPTLYGQYKNARSVVDTAASQAKPDAPTA